MLSNMLLTLGLTTGGNGSFVDLSHQDRWYGYTHYQQSYAGEQFSTDAVRAGYPILRGTNYTVTTSLALGLEQHYDTKIYNELYFIAMPALEMQVQGKITETLPYRIFVGLQPGKYYDTISKNPIADVSNYRNQTLLHVGVQFELKD